MKLLRRRGRCFAVALHALQDSRGMGSRMQNTSIRLQFKAVVKTIVAAVRTFCQGGLSKSALVYTEGERLKRTRDLRALRN